MFSQGPLIGPSRAGTAPERCSIEQFVFENKGANTSAMEGDDLAGAK